MSLTELRTTIIEKINHIEDEQQLKEIDEMINWEILFDKDGVLQLNEDQITAIKESQEQIKRGEYFTDEQVRKKTEEWLKK